MAGDTTIILARANVCAEPERNTTQNGTPYMRVRVAVNHRRKNRQTGAWEDTGTDYWTVTEWDTRQMDTYTQMLHKGTAVRVEGAPDLRAYMDKNGQPAVSYGIKYATITLIIPKAKQTPPQQQAYTPAPPVQAAYPQSPAGDPWVQAPTDGGYDIDPEF